MIFILNSLPIKHKYLQNNLDLIYTYI